MKELLMKKYDCHTIILYGSYSRGDFTEESDLDILCFSDAVEDDATDVEFFEGKQLDAWIYRTERMDTPSSFIRVHEGRILLDQRGLARGFLSDIERLFNEGPKKPSKQEREFLQTWLRKMVLRSKKGDLEGNYRRLWALKDSLELYFELQGCWYLGPKKSFNWLEEHDERAYGLFKNAFSDDATQEDYDKLFYLLTDEI
ncbi:nucleotidyltransferase domain-containing protein [Rossellomorea aquimaris]|uniref:nucleotidyltransferase domain-containing protein n=1 Tax=Rossellomorea aquimaris TaxID=189382 RepID=UPI001CD48204|nr:nucleotidyltransferase domain-containing protein [Rossellomorea aquimaris]MCA1054963.1 nucleotidyltransferase domain-containing protein [Rossellomorea aquimaris]